MKHLLFPLTAALFMHLSDECCAQDMDYFHSAEILDQSPANKRQWDTQIAAQQFSFIGDYRNALVYYDNSQQPAPPLDKYDSAYFAGFKAVDARDYIVSRAKTEQVVFINEAHQVPLHRLFTQNLLQGLYDAGFRYLALETFDHSDTLINQRGYPVLSTGTYTREATFRWMVQSALDMGFKLIAYETQNFGSDNVNQRELAQAKNLASFLAKNPGAKLVVHAGAGHIMETTVGEWKPMGKNFRKLTGINPFTIDQMGLMERSDDKFENSFYKMAKPKHSSVFVKGDKPFVESYLRDYYDVQVFHPRTNYINNRPNWFMQRPGMKPHLFRPAELTIACPCLVKAYQAGMNPADAIPLDVIELKTAGEQTALALQPGKYVIHVTNQQGDKQEVAATVNQ